MLKAGKYFIGDPGYAIKDELWGDYCDASFVAESKEDFEGEMEFNGERVFFSSTMYGDGTYSDNYGNDYSVDAGIIGVTPLYKGITDDNIDLLEKRGLVVDINEKIYCSKLNKDGVIEIGAYAIYTGDED